MWASYLIKGFLLCVLYASLNASKEIIDLVTPLFHAAEDVLNVCAELNAINSSVFKDSTDEMQALADILMQDLPKVKVIRIVKLNNETITDAIKRVLGGENENETKH